MPSPIEKLQKFLSLETERRFDNRAVVGGLEKVQPTWDREAKESGIPISLVQAISDKLIQYPTIDSLIREEVVTEILTLLDKAKQYSSQPTTQIPVPAKPESTIYSTSQPKSNGHDSRPLDRNPQQQKNRPIQSKPIPADLPNGLNAPLTVLKGIGGSGAGQFANMGISSLGDLLYYLPRRYDDYSALKPINRLQYEDELTIIAMVTSSSTRNIHGGKRSITELIVSDGTGYLRLNFFNNPYITNRFVQGSQVVVSGKVEMYLGRLVMNHPTIELLEKEHLNTNRIVPVYPLKAGITQQSLRKNIHQVITYWAGRINDFLPGNIRTSASLIDLQTALRQVHFPDSQEKLKLAKDRLAFDEIFLMQLGVQRQKRAWQAGTARVFNTDQTWLEAFTNKLPYQLTGAQTKTIREISQDLASGKAMNRLIQGDVGSGKTIVAAMGISIVGKHQAQSALLAPTSILAEQHYRNLSKALSGSEDSPFNTDEICLLVGDTPEAEKSVIREGLKNGSIKLVIGTHALLEDPVVFSDLQLIVIDEQHRFGVEQRAILRAKGDNPHLLVMTATPIPRSLALT
ncbi:MAG: DEAD/DEAH box helicase, partial [Anaerolineaceae bacterium]|nr:DEAD/DEAH box helicase [Anaerolineaceae bacterium]